MGDAREKILATTARLLEQQGYHATGLNQIVEESGAPKGSLYYYFPDGKQQISEEAVRRTGRDIEENIRGVLESHDTTRAGLEALLETIADQIEESDFRAGGPITTVAIESAPDENRLNEACRDVYDTWKEAFRESLVADGHPPEQGEALASTILSSTEGAIVLARTYQSREPLERMAESLGELASPPNP